MKINEIAIRGYRSLYDIRVRPGDLTVLTGPNNSGKTNFAEAIDFLAEAFRLGLEVAINRKGGDRKYCAPPHDPKSAEPDLQRKCHAGKGRPSRSEASEYA